MLRELFLVNNNLTGSIPEALGALSGLQVLGLADNMLTGSIPKELGMLTLLSSLFLQGNNLEGTIPKELGALRWLSTLHLSRNKLTAIWDHTHNVRDVGPEKVAYSLPGGRRLRILPGGRCKIERVPHLVTTAGWSDGFQPCNNLISLMCSGGGSVPRELRRLLDVLHRCGDPEWRFGLSHNPWAEPPESIVAKGTKSIKGYFEDLYAEPGRVRRSSVKVILVGQEGAGKTRSVTVLRLAIAVVPNVIIPETVWFIGDWLTQYYRTNFNDLQQFLNERWYPIATPYSSHP
ncbi:unnamed protein product [Ectocarpus sp. 12 AP-2014]